MVWWAGSALAGGFAVAQQGAIAGGTGHAGVARTEDPALAWANPAALVDDGGLRLAAGLAVAATRTEARGVEGGWASRTRTPLAAPPHAYASHAWRGWLVGAAVQVPFAGGVRWDDDWRLRTTAVSSAPTFLRVAPFVGRRLGPVHLAIGPHVDVGQLRVARRTDHVTSEGWARVAVAGAGAGIDAAAWLPIGTTFAVGASYKSRTAIRMSGWADFEVPASVAETLPDQRVQSRLVLPDRLVVGARWALAPMTVLIDAEWSAWSVNDALVLDFAAESTPDTVQDNRWRNALAVRGGVEADVGEVTLRAGGYVDGLPDAPTPRQTLSPSSPDGVRIAATVGAGWHPVPSLRIDGFAELLRVLARTSTAPGVDAAFRTRAVVGGATVSMSP